MFNHYTILDCETDGLLDKVTKIHCLCACVVNKENNTKQFYAITDYDQMRNFLMDQKVIVGHNIIQFDVPVFKKILGIEPIAEQIDSLALSWTLFPEREKHGLEYWGDDLGIAKPKIENWNDLTPEEYIHRCSEDVKINLALFEGEIMNYLIQLYKDDPRRSGEYVRYLMFKMHCAQEQVELRWKLDYGQAQQNLSIIEEKYEEKRLKLIKVMPLKNVMGKKERPKVMNKKDGSLSSHGEKWFQFLRDQNLPEHTVGPVKYITGTEPGNPNSPQQLKDWLFSLGWIPDEIKYEREEDGSLREIPQISKDGELTDSVKNLIEANPGLENLDEYYILKHRKGLLEGFVEDASPDNYLEARIKGFTNTLRFQHSMIVNLPTIPKPYWEMVRECLIAPEGYELCGSDMSSLEDNTKRHYMFFFDPEYVKEQTTYAFDAHCDIAILSGAMSRDEECFHKMMKAPEDGLDANRIFNDYVLRNYSQTERMKGSVTHMNINELLSLDEAGKKAVMKKLKPIRLKSKKVNFAGVYGAGPKKISLTAGISFGEAKTLHTTYWIRNKAVKLVADGCIVKKIAGQMWLFNPVSRFWYSLRNEKDKFSTLNQGKLCSV